jgi:outer membrane protein OmpA-like peptidoglycan-associated protein
VNTAELEAKRKAEEDARAAAEARRRADEEAKRKAEEAARAAAEARRRAEEDAQRQALAARQKAEADRCQSELATAVKSGSIKFQRASAELEGSSVATLDALARIASSCPAARIEVGGHTDAEGTAERNQRLSERRANSVADYLKRAGVDAARLTAIGYGQEKPIADNATAEGRALNRRIEFTVRTQ